MCSCVCVCFVSFARRAKAHAVPIKCIYIIRAFYTWKRCSNGYVFSCVKHTYHRVYVFLINGHGSAFQTGVNISNLHAPTYNVYRNRTAKVSVFERCGCDPEGVACKCSRSHLHIIGRSFIFSSKDSCLLRLMWKLWNDEISFKTKFFLCGLFIPVLNDSNRQRSSSFFYE